LAYHGGSVISPMRKWFNYTIDNPNQEKPAWIPSCGAIMAKDVDFSERKRIYL